MILDFYKNYIKKVKLMQYATMWKASQKAMTNAWM